MAQPTSPQLAHIIQGLCDDLTAAATIAPLIADQARHERWHPDGRYPTSPRGELLEEDCQLDYADPTGEAVINAHPTKPSYDTDKLDRWIADLIRLVGSTRSLLDQLPAVTRSVAQGRPARDGRTQTEIDAKRRGGTEEGTESACAVCELGTSIVGPLTTGLCGRHADQNGLGCLADWERAGWPERQPWVIRRRKELAATADELIVDRYVDQP